MRPSLSHKHKESSEYISLLMMATVIAETLAPEIRVEAEEILTMIYCARCNGRVHLTGACKTCKKIGISIERMVKGAAKGETK